MRSPRKHAQSGWRRCNEVIWSVEKSGRWCHLKKQQALILSSQREANPLTFTPSDLHRDRGNDSSLIKVFQQWLRGLNTTPAQVLWNTSKWNKLFAWGWMVDYMKRDVMILGNVFFFFFFFSVWENKTEHRAVDLDHQDRSRWITKKTEAVVVR